MALLRELTPLSKDRHRVHGEVDCGYSVFHADGRKYVQLDTYGSADRQIPGKTSQTIQLDEFSAAALVEVLRQVFPGL
jgi:hypothetical protein